MLNERAAKGFLFAFLCVLAGGLICIAGGFNPALEALILVGLALVALGLLVGFFTLAA